MSDRFTRKGSPVDDLCGDDLPADQPRFRGPVNSGSVNGDCLVPERDELKAWLDWLQQAAEAGGTLSKLALLELRKAVADGRRLIVVALFMLPVLFLAWLGFSVLLGWVAYHYSLSIGYGVATFLAVQLATLWLMWFACKQYRKSFSLPTTRRHLQAFMEEARNGADAAKR